MQLWKKQCVFNGSDKYIIIYTLYFICPGAANGNIICLYTVQLLYNQWSNTGPSFHLLSGYGNNNTCFSPHEGDGALRRVFDLYMKTELHCIYCYYAQLYNN